MKNLRHIVYQLGVCLVICASASAAAWSQRTIHGAAAHPKAQPDAAGASIIVEGMRLQLLVGHVDAANHEAGFRSEENVRFRFLISDTASGRPITGAAPAAWLNHATDENGQHPCTRKVAMFLSGSIFSRADVDLNTFYVVVMNDDASLSVVDPLFGYGGTQLLAIVQLSAPATDWTLTTGQDILCVSMPAAGKVALVNTASWRVEREIDVDGMPGRVALGPDDRYLWAACSGLRGGSDKIVAIDLANGRVAAAFPVGGGRHDLAVSDDGHFVYATSSTAGTLSIINAGTLHTTADIHIGGAPVSVAYSALARTAYVADSVSGTISVVDAARRKVVATIQAEPGISSVAFAPGGRLAFVTNPHHDAVNIIDAAATRLVQTATVGFGPQMVTFSDRLAYVRAAGSEVVTLIPLDQVGKAGAIVPIVDVPSGVNPVGKFAMPSLAAGIVQAPTPGSMLIANPLDKSIYYYMEGMAAPMGTFGTYGHEARAVTVVDRSLREVSSGVYETIAKLGAPGTYDLAFFMNTPRIIHCFTMEVAPAADTAQAAQHQPGDHDGK
jgi:YVTN family beta-propeller protein